MDPTMVFCPNLACAARGQSGQGNISIHSRKEQRFLCTVCHKTFSATKGTALYRLRTPAETVTLVLTLQSGVAKSGETPMAFSIVTLYEAGNQKPHAKILGKTTSDDNGAIPFEIVPSLRPGNR